MRNTQKLRAGIVNNIDKLLTIEFENSHPKKFRKHLNGEVIYYWKEDFVDEDTGEVVTIERNKLIINKKGQFIVDKKPLKTIHQKVRRMDVIQDVVRIGESSSYSGLTIDENGILIKVNENALPIMPGCKCHTHSFNGKPITKDTIVRSYDGTKVGRFEDIFSY